MKQNLGKLDRIFRLVLAIWLLGPFTPIFYVQAIYTTAWAVWLIIILGLIALLESFTGWCWLHSILKINNKNQ